MSTILEKSGESRIYFHALDMLRGFAAFLVVLSHARACFLKDYRSNVSCVFKPFYFISDFGHQAVIIFFVLSGCVVGRIVLRGMQTETWSWRDYLFDRLTRLWIVLVPALCLTAIFDFLSLSLAGPRSFVHTGNEFAHIFHQPLAAQLSWSIFLGNIFYLQTIYVSTFGSNNPLWSLANEFWYYIVYPLLLVGIVSRKSCFIKIGSVMGGIVLLMLAGWPILSLFPVWLSGAIAFGLFQKIPPRREWISLGLGGATLSTGTLLFFSRTGALPHEVGATVSDNILGFSCAVLIYFALSTQPPILVANVAGLFSKFSYSVYLLHLPLITFVAAIFIGTNDRRLDATINSALILIACIFGTYVYAYCVFLLTENNTSSIRRWLRRRIKLSES